MRIQRAHVLRWSAVVLIASAGSTVQATIHTIINNGLTSWVPSTVNVNPRDTVRWTWTGIHSTQSQPSSPKQWSSPTTNGGTYQIIIELADGPGPFPFECGVHPHMSGVINVNQSFFDVFAGVDLFVTPPGGSIYGGFSTNPIPPGFFGPGSDPFMLPIPLMGNPVRTSPPNVLGPTDCIVRRLGNTGVLNPMDPPVQVPIEIVALHLVSVAPITITSNGGMNPESWNVQLVLSSQQPQQQGMARIQRTTFEGGLFDCMLPVQPRFIFTRLSPPMTLELDVSGGAQPFFIQTQPEYFSYGPADWMNHTVAGMSVGVDHDYNNGTPPIQAGPTNSNYYAGVRFLRWSTGTCYLLDYVHNPSNAGLYISLSSGIPTQTSGSACIDDSLGGGCALIKSACSTSPVLVYGGDGTSCIPMDPCMPQPLAGITIQQVDFDWQTVDFPDSKTGRLHVEVEPLLNFHGVDSGYLNGYSDEGWVIQNLRLAKSDSLPDITTYFRLSSLDSVDVLTLPIKIELVPLALTSFGDGIRVPYPVTPFTFNAEGGGELFTSISLSPLISIPWIPTGETFSSTQPNKVNIQTAQNQCFPMSIANSLQYLENRYGLPVPHTHAKGLKGDSTLVGKLDTESNRNAPSRTNGSGVWFVPMVNGKFKYLKDNGLEKKIINKHQGVGYGGAGNQLPPGDYSSNGSTSKDESVGGKVTFDWICGELAKGEDVEIVFTYDDAAGNPTGGHAVRVFEYGKTLGVPWIGYVHDAKQTGQGDLGDSLGLECVRKPMFDSDGDGIPNLGAANQEIRFAFSESADTDRDGVTNGLDNAPNTFNPGQEDLNGNGVGDVNEGGLQSEPIGSFTLSGPTTFGPFPNMIPPFPDHKNIWFLGSATNSAVTDRQVVVHISYASGGPTTTVITDTTIVHAGQTREIFGSVQLPDCPTEVSVTLVPLGGELISVSGSFNHICYPLVLSCCLNLTGNTDCSPDDLVDISDLTILIDHLFINNNPLCCQAEGNVDGSPLGDVDISDLTMLIDHLFINNQPTAPCL